MKFLIIIFDVVLLIFKFQMIIFVFELNWSRKITLMREFLSSKSIDSNWNDLNFFRNISFSRSKMSKILQWFFGRSNEREWSIIDTGDINVELHWHRAEERNNNLKIFVNPLSNSHFVPIGCWEMENWWKLLNFEISSIIVFFLYWSKSIDQNFHP